MLSKIDPFTGDLCLKVSILNTALRDDYDSLLSLCEDQDINYQTLLTYLKNNNYDYIANINQIKPL